MLTRLKLLEIDNLLRLVRNAEIQPECIRLLLLIVRLLGDARFMLRGLDRLWIVSVLHHERKVTIRVLCSEDLRLSDRL